MNYPCLNYGGGWREEGITFHSTHPPSFYFSLPPSTPPSLICFHREAWLYLNITMGVWDARQWTCFQILVWKNQNFLLPLESLTWGRRVALAVVRGNNWEECVFLNVWSLVFYLVCCDRSERRRESEKYDFFEKLERPKIRKTRCKISWAKI